MVVIEGGKVEHGVAERHTYGSDDGTLVVVECNCGERTTPYPLELVALAEEELRLRCLPPAPVKRSDVA